MRGAQASSDVTGGESRVKGEEQAAEQKELEWWGLSGAGSVGIEGQEKVLLKCESLRIRKRSGLGLEARAGTTVFCDFSTL